MYTEIEEAKKKWCPMARTSHFGNANPHNRTVYGDEYPIGLERCIADECMLWQWKDFPANVGYCGLVKHRG